MTDRSSPYAQMVVTSFVGIGRMYEAISSESEEEVRVFRSREDALRWLRPDASPELLSTILGADE